MSSAYGFLSNYGMVDARREKRHLRIVLTIVGSTLLGTFLYFYFRTFNDEREVKRFLETLSRHDYKSAYAQFGCTEAAPCRAYDFEKFLGDWGEKSPYADVSRVKITLAEPCGNTAWVTVKHPGQKELGLSVDPVTRTLTFTPEARCPGVWRLREFPERLWGFVKQRMG